VKKTVSKFAFQMQPAALHNGKITPGDIFKAVDVDNSDDITMVGLHSCCIHPVDP
jgi:hypothetical protein